MTVLALSTSLLPEEVEEEKVEDDIAYLAHRKGGEGKEWDSLFPLVQSWLQGSGIEPQNFQGYNSEKFKKFARQFFFDKKGRLYKCHSGERHKLVVDISRQMFMLKSVYDSLGHRGSYATKILIQECFW